MSANPQIAAERIARHLRLLGLSCSTANSGLSESIYVNVSTDDHEIKIRVSNHDLPPTYGETNGWAQIEVDPRKNPVGREDSTVSWAIAVKLAAEIFGRSPHRQTLDAIRRAETSRQAQIAAVRESIERQRADDQERNERAAVRRSENERILEELGLGHLTGQARKRKLKKLRAQGRA